MGLSVSDRARGYTLVEVMISMAVLMIGLLGSLAVINLGIIRTAHARKVTAAQHLGSEILERLRLEVRFDAEGSLPAGASNSGVSNGGAFTAGSAWRGDRLPYLSSDSVPAAAGAVLTTCQPGGSDGVDYGVGPLPFRVESNLYWACYGLAPGAAGFPVNSVSAVVKVIWPSSDGYRSRHVAGVLVSGG